jgi:hypothetical protein
MRMRREPVAFRQLEPKHKQAFFARIAVEHGRLRSRRDRGRSSRPLDVADADDGVPVTGLRHRLRYESGRRHGESDRDGAHRNPEALQLQGIPHRRATERRDLRAVEIDLDNVVLEVAVSRRV